MAEQKEHQKEESFLIKYKREIVGGLITLLAFIFVFLNYQHVEFWFFGTMKIRLIILLIAFYGLGFLTSYIYTYFKKKELKSRIKELEKGQSAATHIQDVKTIKSLEEKIEKLEKMMEKNTTPPTTPPPPSV